MSAADAQLGDGSGDIVPDCARGQVERLSGLRKGVVFRGRTEYVELPSGERAVRADECAGGNFRVHIACTADHSEDDFSQFLRRGRFGYEALDAGCQGTPEDSWASVASHHDYVGVDFPEDV